MDSPLADSAPADAVEIEVVDHSSDWREAARAVRVDVIEGHAGIESVGETEANSIAQVRADAQPAAHELPLCVRQAASGHAETIVFGARVTAMIRIYERG